MKIVGLISFFDEYPSWLAATVASCARVCDHVVCVDGAYLLMSGGAGSSGSDQHAAIADAAAAVGLGLTLHVPRDKWAGDQVGKRAFMFEAGRLVAQDAEDWFLVIDADEVVIEAPHDLRARLAAADEDVATCDIVTRRDDVGLLPVPTRDADPVRRLYRNQPGLTVVGTHYGYTAAGIDLWSGVPVLALPGLVIDHKSHRRAAERRARQEAYYLTRELAGIEKEMSYG